MLRQLTYLHAGPCQSSAGTSRLRKHRTASGPSGWSWRAASTVRRRAVVVAAQPSGPAGDQLGFANTICGWVYRCKRGSKTFGPGSCRGCSSSYEGRGKPGKGGQPGLFGNRRRQRPGLLQFGRKGMDMSALCRSCKALWCPGLPWQFGVPDHRFAAGFSSSQAVAWRERATVFERAGGMPLTVFVAARCCT